MKKGSDNSRESASVQIYEKLQAIGQKVIIFEPTIDTTEAWTKDVIGTFSEFAMSADLIVANRWDNSLEPIAHKVLCRDIYHEN